jgi:hypothetical protein
MEMIREDADRNRLEWVAQLRSLVRAPQSGNVPHQARR